MGGRIIYGWAPGGGALELPAQVGFPEWLEVSDKEFRGVFKAVPGRDEVLPDINENLIVELYSK